jgi:small subunit ribosomal protein S19
VSRSIKKGPFVDKKLAKRVEQTNKANQTQIIRTYSRSSTITPDMIGLNINVYNGKSWVTVYVTDNLVGHKLGEFAPTRIFRSHVNSDKRASAAGPSKAAAPAAKPAAAASAPAAE